MRRCLTNALFAVAVTFSAPALAQDASANCPPGAWFCEEVTPPAVPDAEASPEPQEAAPAPLPPPEAHGRPRTRVAVPPPPPGRAGRPPVVIYQPPPGGGPPPQVVIVAPSAPPPRVAVRAVPPPPPPAKPRRWHRRWGLNMRLEGVALGREGANEDAGMGGIGLSLRYRPVPAFAFDLGVDVLSGTDYNGFQRTEMPVSLSGILFVNPKSRVQFYLIGGMHFSHAQVETDTILPAEEHGDGESFMTTKEYTYFGGQAGLGLEFRISRLIALNIDGLGFVRHRTDDDGAPEFTDPATGQTTNKSGGGLFRGGLTFWW